MFNVRIETIDHNQHRYDTCGDWFWDYPSRTLIIKVSNMDNWMSEALVAIHELVEAVLCQQRGISAEQVDVFDFGFKGDGEPGDDPKAPYHWEHVFAERIEQQLAKRLGVKWPDHEQRIENLYRKEVTINGNETDRKDVG